MSVASLLASLFVLGTQWGAKRAASLGASLERHVVVRSGGDEMATYLVIRNYGPHERTTLTASLRTAVVRPLRASSGGRNTQLAKSCPFHGCTRVRHISGEST